MKEIFKLGYLENVICCSADLRRRSNQFDADSLDGDHPYEHEGEHKTFIYHIIIVRFI
jgi:hypothetical protein